MHPTLPADSSKLVPNQRLIISTLQEIQAQNNALLQKIDRLESTLSKKATLAGAVAGAISGGGTAGALMVGFELLKAKFGG